jgi:hypothetical protein
VYGPAEYKLITQNNGFYEELQQVFCHCIIKYRENILLLGFEVKLQTQNISKPTICDDSLVEISDSMGVNSRNCATSKRRVVKSKVFPKQNFHKYTIIPTERFTI